MKTAKIWTDGGARGNPGPAGIGAVIEDPSGELLAEVSEYIGEATNNQAEYRAMIAALEKAQALGIEDVTIHADSELMVRQLQGKYKVKNMGIQPLFAQAKDLLSGFRRYTLRHVRREANAVADALVNQALDAAL